MEVAEIFLLILSFFAIVVCLLQSGKSDGASGAITGGNRMNIFTRVKERGVDKILSIITYVVLAGFFIAAICAMYLA